tara:strand:- start:384 stop:1631 length:1248 start_codon:yes stop_codon:yes gene_type:complete
MKNVLILTPDRVGSTLLQRLVTIYMLRKGGDKPIINLHELTNGLMKYYSPLFNQEILGKPSDGKPWGYYQTLNEVVELLNSADHYKTSRLAHYHIKNRQDTMAEQVPFYNYLNDNFYIISCQRENLFEHALSWVIQSHSKKLNVYSPSEKINLFEDIYKNGIVATQEGLSKYLAQYLDYTKWVDNHFNVQSYFNYDKDLKNIEQYILGLDFMQGHENNTWKDMFGQNWEDWNTCHRMLPNLLLDQPTPSETTVALMLNTNEDITRDIWDSIAGKDWPQGPPKLLAPFNNTIADDIQTEIMERFPNINPVVISQENYNFLENQLPAYCKTYEELSKLIENKILVTGVPIKLQSLKEKKHIIKNFDQCIEWYNNWVIDNNFGKIYSTDELNLIANDEETRLNTPVSLTNLLNKPLAS